jgi:hypothetical protein
MLINSKSLSTASVLSKQVWLVEGKILPGEETGGLAVYPTDLLQAMVATRAACFQQLGRQWL